MIKRFLIPLILCSTLLFSEQEMIETVEFTPPSGWKIAENDALPPNVKVMVIGEGKNYFPPSINLSTEKYSGTLKEYLQIVKNINQDQDAEWKDLGSILTEAGEASLSQAIAPSTWGEIKMMHVILVRDGMTYILTAAALKEEFPHFYKDFFRSLRSLRIKEEPAPQE